MIDIHSHILWGIDDGSKDKNMSIKMLQLAKESGIKHIVATPHYMRGRFQCEYGEVIKAVEELKEIAINNHIDIKIYAGQEVYYTDKLLEDYNEKRIGTINNSRYMLIELPMSTFNIEEVINTIYELKIRGVNPIIAHPERYKIFIEKPKLINKFIDEGYLFQLNTGSLTGEFGRKVKRTAKLFLKHNIYSVVGSDAHRDIGRNTNISSFLSIVKKDQKDKFSENAKDILLNKSISIEGKLVKKTILFWKR